MKMAMAAFGVWWFWQSILIPIQVTAMVGMTGARVPGVRVEMAGGVAHTDGNGDATVMLNQKGDYRLDVFWPDGCHRVYTWQQSTDVAQHIFVQREDCQ